MMKRDRKEIARIVFAFVILIALLLAAFRPWRFFAGAGSEAQYTCTVNISCADALENMELVRPEKAELIPADGWLAKDVEVSFSAERTFTVLQALQQACRQEGLAVSTSGTPAYVEGIGGLFSGDAGDVSGWTYTVDGETVMESCAVIHLTDGQTVDWSFVCTWE